MYKVKVADIEEFRNSRDAWNRLALEMYLPSIFCTWEWIYTWWEHFGKDYKPLILFVYNDAELKGILPLASKTAMSRDGLMGRILYYCGSQEVYPDHLDIISSKEEAVQCLNVIFDFLSSEYKDWDVLNISHASQGNSLLSYLDNRSFPSGLEVRRISVAPYIPVECSFEEYLKSVDRSRRYKMRRNKKRLDEQYGIKYGTYEASRSHEGLKALFDLHQRRANTKNMVSTFQGPHIFSFHDAFLQLTVEKGWVWLKSLGNEEITIASFYGFCFGNRTSYYQMGIDPEWQYYSPGMLIMLDVIRETFLNSYKECDLLRGGEQYKGIWTKEKRDLLNVNIFNGTTSGKMSKVASHSKTIIKGLLRK